MKYYLSTLSVCQGEGESKEFGLICAANQEQANQLNNDRASLWGGDVSYEHGPGSWHFDWGDESAVVSAESAVEISYVTFSEMRKSLPVFGDTSTGELTSESAPEQVKTLARRIGNQLEKLGAKVPHGQLLQAISASIGETDWAVLKHKPV